MVNLRDYLKSVWCATGHIYHERRVLSRPDLHQVKDLFLYVLKILSDGVTSPCHAKIGPTQKWSPRPILAAKNGPPGPLLVAKNGPFLPKLVLGGPNLATKIGLGDQFGLLRMVLLPYSDC